MLKKDGEFIFEIQYLLRTIKDLTFDNVYHEHVNYWCLLSILNFFENSNMKVYKVKGSRHTWWITKSLYH